MSNPPGPEVPDEIRALVPCGKQRGFDYWPPDYSQADYRPKSAWSKAGVIRQARRHKVPRAVLNKMDGMTYGELWSSCMTSVGWMRRGNDGTWRWTEIWTIDLDAVAELGAARCGGNRDALTNPLLIMERAGSIQGSVHSPAAPPLTMRRLN